MKRCWLVSIVLFILQFSPISLYSQTQWEPLGPFGGTVTFLTGDGGDWVYTGIEGSGVFRSQVGGRIWEAVNNGLPGSNLYAGCVAPDGRIFCGGDNVLAVSTDHGSQWRVIPSPMSSYPITNILVLADSQIILSYKYGNLINCSSNNGVSWRSVGGIPSWGGDIETIQRGPGSTVYIATMGQGVYQLNPRTGVLAAINYNLPKATAGATPYFDCMGLASFADGELLLAYLGDMYSFKHQTQQWTRVPNSNVYGYFYLDRDSLLYACTYHTLRSSTDRGRTWTNVSVAQTPAGAKYFAKVNSTFLSSWGEGLWRSDDNGTSWVESNDGIARTDINCVIASPSNTVIIGTGTAGIYRCPEGGTTWSNILFPSPGGYRDNIISLKQNSKSTIFAASMGASRTVWRSTTDGASWTPTTFSDSGYTNGMALVMTDIVINSQDEVFVSGYSYHADSVGGMFKSTNDGVTWKRVFACPANSAPRSFLLANDSIVVMGTLNKGFFRSTNLGGAWAQTQGTNGLNEIRSIVQDSGSIILASSVGAGILRSTDMGLTWSVENTGLTNLFVRTLSKLPNGMVFAGTDKGGFVSNDHGLSWQCVTTNVPFRSVSSVFAVGGGTIYVSTEAGVYKATGLVPTAVHPSNDPIEPHDFRLSQNYPNPFNPSTTISFGLPTSVFVTMKIFDVMGRVVATLVSDELPAGNYTRQWDASEFPSGMYFFRMQAGNFMQTKKMVFTK